ncbi:MAG TPA: hypothetical protein VEW48_12105 [Thermoanaerobaculia bacterium]|nr:hypothetical protein [Thermoanaerobaculia bacterium]
MEPTGRKRLGLALTLAPLLLPFLLVARLGVNAVRLDEFFYADFVRAVRDGGDWLPWLWWQHNEHRVIATKLVMIPNALFLHWSRVAEMYVSAVLCLFIVLGLWRLYQRSGGRDLLVFAPVAWLACSLAQYEVLLYGLLSCHFFTILGIVWALVCLDRPGFGGFAAAIFFGCLASFSIVNGFLVWPVGLFLLLARGRRPAVCAAWLLSGATAVALNLIGYHFQVPLRRPLDFSPAGLVRAGRYGLVLLGAPLSGGSIPWGFVLGGLLVAAAAATGFGWWRRGRAQIQEEALPAALVLFGILSCAMVSVGRVAMISPLQSRYVPYSSLAIAGAYLLTCAGLRRGAVGRFTAALTLLVAGLAAADLQGLAQALEWRLGRLQDKFLLQTFDRQRDQDLSGLFFDIPHLRQVAPYLRDERLASFADPQDLLLLVRWQEGVPLGEILPGRAVEQTLVCPVGELRDAAVVFATYARPNTSHVLLTVETGGRRLGARTVLASDLKDSGWVEIPLDEPLRDCQGREIRIRVESADALPGNAVTLWTYPPYYQGVLRQGDSAVPDRSLGVTLNGFHSGVLK